MTIITRYINSQILQYFSIVLIIVIGIYLAVDFIEKIDDFIEAQAPFNQAIIFFAGKIPFIVARIIPVAILLAVLVTFGLMSKHNELIALHSGGVSVTTLLKPTLSIGILAALLLFIIAEGIVPLTIKRSNRIWLQEVKGQKAVATREHDIWLRAEHVILHLTHYHHETQVAQGITYHQFDKHFRLVRRLDAQSAQYKNGKWQLQQVVDQQRIYSTNQYDVKLYAQLEANLNVGDEDLKTVAFQSEEMSFNALRHYIQKVESDGYAATSYKVDLHAKIAFPFVCILMSLMGSGLALQGRIRAGMSISITLGLGVIFLYWILYSFCMSLGYGGMLPPVIAAWAANFVFTCLAGVLFLNAQ